MQINSTIGRSIFYGVNKTAATINTEWAAKRLSKIFVTPFEYTTQWEGERELMSHAVESKLIFDAERNISVYEWGEGEPVLLAHGLSSQASQMTIFVNDIVGAGYKAVSFDAPAHGNSDGNETALPEFAEALKIVAKKYGKLKSIIAHSNGCASTIIGMSEGVEAEKVVLVSPPEDLSGYLVRLAIMAGFNSEVAYRARDNLEKRFGRKFEESRGEVLAPNINSEFLIIHDKQDKMVPYEDGVKLSKLLKESDLVLTSGLGHTRILSDATVKSRAISFAVS